VFIMSPGSVGRSLLLGDIGSPLGVFVTLAGLGCLVATGLAGLAQGAGVAAQG
jgi:hypothetical protein